MSFLLKLFKLKIKHYCISICGLDNAGKTTIIKYFIHGKQIDTVSTSGVNRETISLPGLEIIVHDLGGQPQFRGSWQGYNENADAIVYVVDATDTERMEEAKQFLDLVLTHQRKDNAPLLLLLNKVDSDDRISADLFGQIFQLNSKDRPALSWACFETSGLTGEGLIDSFQWLVNKLEEA